MESKDSTECTPEEELAEKLRVKKLQEDSDLELAKDAFGEQHLYISTFCELYYYDKMSVHVHLCIMYC